MIDLRRLCNQILFSFAGSTRSRLLIAFAIAFVVRITYVPFLSGRGDVESSALLRTEHGKSFSQNQNRAFEDEHSERHQSVASEDVAFKGARKLLSLLRKAYKQKIANPLPHCRYISTKLQNAHEIRLYNRAIEVDWIGRNISSVEPTWSASEKSSCRFAALAFPPTSATLSKAIQQKTYVSPFYTANQCGIGGTKGAFHWGAEKPVLCHYNNFGGTLGATTKEECIKESVGGNIVLLWIGKNSNGAPFRCLKRFLHDNETIRQHFNMQALELAATKLANSSHDVLFDRMMAAAQLGEGGFGSAENWNKILFNTWSMAILEDSAKQSSVDVKAAAGLLALLRTERKSSFTACVEKLIPITTNITSVDDYRWWRERGLHLTVSKMADSPSTLLRLFPGSLGGVLPPPPTAVYSINAVLSAGVNVPFEFFSPGCTPYWQAVSSEKNALKAFVDAGNRNETLFADLARSPHALREEILRSCAEGEIRCPFPTYDLVIDVNQVFCNGFFHFTIEVWPRIAPFLESLLADNLPKFAIHIGCDKLKEFHPQFYDLIGLNSSKVELIGEETVFAKEVIVPTEGLSHSPLFNYWNLVSVRTHVTERLGPIQPPGQKKTVLVIARDASRRGDENVYNQKFMEDLSAYLPSHHVTTYRSSDTKLMACIECQVRAFMAADVIIGSHGAGLSHILFAKSSATVLERIVSHGNSGIYAELSFILGMKYFPMDNLASAKAYSDIILFADSY